MKLVANLVIFGLVALVVVPSSFGAEPLVKKGAAWKYFDGEEMPEDWQATDFDDEKWKSGSAPLGYGEKDAKTKVSFGDNPREKRLVVFFRTTFKATGDKEHAKLCGRVRCDDGAVVYLNGKEVHRHNVGPGKVTMKTTAAQAIGPDGPIEEVYHIFFIDPKLLKEGDNTISVSVHQAYESSSDLLMDLQLDGVNEEEAKKAKKEQESQAPPQRPQAAQPFPEVI